MTALLPWWLCFWGGFWPSFGTDPLENRFPLEANGDIHFQADAARFMESGRPQVEVYLAIPEEPGVPAAGADSVRYELTIEPLDEEERTLARFATQMVLPPVEPAGETDGWPVPRRWIRLRPAWVDGTVGLRVRVENHDREKRGLFDQIRGRRWQGEAAARLGPAGPPAASGEILSDLFFVWGPQAEVDAARSETGLRAIRGRLQPNPYRYYGLHQRVLTAYWERYRTGAPPGAADGWTETCRVVSLVDSAEVYVSIDTLGAATAAEWTLRRFDISALPGGSYRLRVELRGAGDPGALLAATTGDFQVVWESRSWAEDENEVAVVGRAILPADEFERFRAFDRGAQEVYLRDLWNRHAPAEPGRPNPLEEKFRARAEYARKNFHGIRPGLRSDRGRVYVRFGPPDEIRTAIDPRGADQLVYQLPEEMVDAGEDEATSRNRVRRQKLLFDYSAYEVWEYTTIGDPLFPAYLNPGQHLGLKFVFADERGDGDYVLVYTNLAGGLQ